MKQSLNYLYKVLFLLSALLLLPMAILTAQTNFVKDNSNPILPLGAPGAWDDLEAAYAHVLFDGSMHQMWYSGSEAQYSYRIGYATSTDGISSWNKHANPVLGVGAPGAFDNAEVWLPWVLFDGDLYKMWYTGNINNGGIGYITTTDPTSWTRQRTTPVLTGGGSGAWDNLAFGPVVLYKDSLYHMWYGGHSSQSGLWQTGYATSADGVTWNKHSANPVLPVGAASDWDAVAAIVGSVIFEDGLYHMWYHGTSGDPFSGGKIGYATSPDGVNWTKDALNNPILAGGFGAWDVDGNWFPRVMKDGNSYRMWYTGRNSSGLDRLGYAEDPVMSIGTPDNAQPTHFQLQQNYPNPFNPATTIEYSLPQSGFVTLKVYNMLGEAVAGLVESHQPAGSYTVNFDAKNLTSGIYYYTLAVNGLKQTRKMVLIR